MRECKVNSAVSTNDCSDLPASHGRGISAIFAVPQGSVHWRGGDLKALRNMKNALLADDPPDAAG
ncbi:hypothetical protein AMC87_CH03342 [Rhizobium phaseoli]|nr:hypothetical protein AMC87_CH03342 [Rhizobium phaseoli]